MVGGRMFHRVEPETAKLLSPYLVVLERGLRIGDVSDADTDTGVTIAAR